MEDKPSEEGKERKRTFGLEKREGKEMASPRFVRGEPVAKNRLPTFERNDRRWLVCLLPDRGVVAISFTSLRRFLFMPRS